MLIMRSFIKKKDNFFFKRLSRMPCFSVPISLLFWSIFCFLSTSSTPFLIIFPFENSFELPFFP